MQFKNNVNRMLVVMSIATLLIAWGAVTSFAQSGMNQEKQTSKTGNQSMANLNSYLIYVPGSSEANTCQDIKNEFSKTMGSQPGTEMKHDPGTSTAMTQNQGAWEWGCSADNKALYLYTKASSEKAALDQVPSNLRNQAKVIRMSSLSEQQMPEKKMKQGSNY